MMLATVSMWGNSLALRIPKALAEEAGINKGSELEISYVDGEIRLKATRRKRYDLDELLASVQEGGLTEEWDLGPPVGNEVW